MSRSKNINQIQRFRNRAKSTYFALAILLGLILGICSEMLTGFVYDAKHYILWFISSLYILIAPAFVVTFIFYLIKLIIENLGVFLYVEKAIYKHKNMLMVYEDFLNEKEKQLLSKKLKDHSAHFVRWLIRSVLYTIGALTCLPFLTASAMTAANMHAPTLIIYNMLIVGTVFPLLVMILFCEAILYIVGKINSKPAQIRVINRQF